MKKRSNIALFVIFLLALSIPVAAYAYFRHLMNETEKDPVHKELHEIRLKSSGQDSLQISLQGNDKTGFEVKTSVVKHHQE
jgi:hypothetical protein